MTITILFRNGKELSVKCDSADIKKDKMTGRVTNIHFKGVKENEIFDLSFDDVIAIYRNFSDEVEE